MYAVLHRISSEIRVAQRLQKTKSRNFGTPDFVQQNLKKLSKVKVAETKQKHGNLDL